MGFLNKIFKNEKVPPVPYSTAGKLFPVLKPGDWPGLPYAVWSPLVQDEEINIIVIGYAYDTHENLSFLTQQKAVGRTLQEIHKEATANIIAYPYAFSETIIDDRKILTASGNDFSSEKVLDPAFIAEAGRILQTRDLLISVPRRRCVMICNYNESIEFRTKFSVLHWHAWQDASYGNAPIASGLLIIQDLKLSGYYDLEETIKAV